MTAFQTYDYALAAGGSMQLPASGSFFRVQSATGKLNVTAEFGVLNGLSVGQGARSPFRILQIKDASGAPNVGTIIVGDDAFVDNQIILASSSAIALDAPTQDVLRRPLSHTGSFATNNAVAANTAIQVFSPGSNPNGAIILTAQGLDATNGAASPVKLSLVAKSGVPISVIDGVVYACAGTRSLYPNRSFTSFDLSVPQYVPPGLGLYFIAAAASDGWDTNMNCRYRLL